MYIYIHIWELRIKMESSQGKRGEIGEKEMNRGKREKEIENGLRMA